MDNMARTEATRNIIVEETSPESSPSPQRTKSRRLKGYAASSGVVAGPCIVASSLEELARLPDGAILVYEAASPKLIPIIGRLRALVTEKGGSLAAASNCARENGIPAVVGVTGLMKSIHSGAIIRVDGLEGAVDIIP